MKKNLYFFLAFAAGLIFTACDGGNNAPDPVGTTYPRVQLIEHFTGADCGYCPGGMDQIYAEYSKDPDNIVWVSNHYGFGSDDYTISGSSVIGKKLNVQGAPNISINRYSYTVEGTKSRAYHPYYTAAVMKKQETTSNCCISLERSYDASTGNLHVKATVKTGDETLDGVFLTLGVTESGMQGRQEDYTGSWEGWRKFTHTHTIRTYATPALGEAVMFEKRVAVAEYDIEMDSKWVAENCEIVAWVTAVDTYYPVLNAAKLPVVEGTKGGEDTKHGGVELVPVAETYPEEGAPAADLTLTFAAGQYAAQNGYTMMLVSAYNLDQPVATVQNTSMFPYVQFYVALPTGSTSIPAGTYNIVTSASAQVGDVLAGERNDAEFSIDGSQLYYVYQKNTSLYIYSQWLLVSGTVTVTDGGFSINARTLNGSTVTASFTGNVHYERAQAPARSDASMLMEFNENNVKNTFDRVARPVYQLL
ncbi:MAG: Omp28-related outer membrane protein [Bacteroidales bacterium]|nr:Omp28-related outer membrane protein [Candidatus Colicola faecequi]